MGKMKELLGYHEKLDYRVRVAYVINGISMILAMLFIYFYAFYTKYDAAIPGIVLYFGSTVLVFVFLKLGYYEVAKALILVGFMLQESSIVFFLFPSEIHFNLFYFIVAPITFFIFDYDKKLEKLLTFIFSISAILLFTASELFFRSNFVIKSTPEITILFNSISAFSAILTISIVFFFFSVEIVKVQNELKHLANTDALTSIYNRRLFFELAEYQFELARKYDRAFSVVLLDVDHFKRVNDSFGHPAGDQVLIQMAELIRGMIRRGDILSRYGGEEFALLIKDVDSEESVAIAEKIRKTVEEYEFKIEPDISVKITVSLGVTDYQKKFIQFNEMIKSADNNLYGAKENGRNCVVKET